MAEVVLTGVSKSFDDIDAVCSLDLTIADGAFVVLLGPTGAGKTTTLRLIAGLETTDAGQITIGGLNAAGATPAQRDVAMVFQQYSLYPHLSVRDNLSFPLKAPGHQLKNEEITRKVNSVANLLQITGKLASKATELSGGEMQRVAIGRALIRRPAIYLFDEPLSSLDAKLRSELRVELKRIQQELGATILYVTHDQVEAMTMATDVGVLDSGRLVQFGSPREIYEDPNSIYVATRLGIPRINIVPVDLFADPQQPAHTVSLGLRPEHIVIGGDGPGQRSSIIKRVERLGDQTRLYLDVAGQTLVGLVDPHTEMQVGGSVQVGALNPLLFDKDGNRIRL